MVEFNNSLTSFDIDADDTFESMEFEDNDLEDKM